MDEPTSGERPVRVLLLMRHAEAGHPDGTRDLDRPLTAPGREQAAAAGRWLTGGGWEPAAALVSESLRTRETVAATALFTSGERHEVTAALWEATPDQVLDAIRETSADTACLLVVGHAPSIPGLARDLAGPPDAAVGRPVGNVVTLPDHFLSATVAVFSVAGDWTDLGRRAETPPARLIAVFSPDR